MYPLIYIFYTDIPVILKTKLYNKGLKPQINPSCYDPFRCLVWITTDPEMLHHSEQKVYNKAF